MKVDIEQGNARGALIEKCLRRDRGIVDEAITAEQVAGGVMTWRTAECEDGLGAFVHRGLSGQRDVDAGARRFPGAIADRGFGGQRIVTDLTVDMFRYPRLLHAARRPAGGNRFALETGRAPVPPAGFEKANEFGIVDAQHRFDTEFARCDDFAEADIGHSPQDMFGAHRAFEWRHQLSAVEFGSGIAQDVLFAVNS